MPQLKTFTEPRIRELSLQSKNWNLTLGAIKTPTLHNIQAIEVTALSAQIMSMQKKMDTLTLNSGLNNNINNHHKVAKQSCEICNRAHPPPCNFEKKDFCQEAACAGKGMRNNRHCIGCPNFKAEGTGWYCFICGQPRASAHSHKRECKEGIKKYEAEHGPLAQPRAAGPEDQNKQVGVVNFDFLMQAHTHSLTRTWS